MSLPLQTSAVMKQDSSLKPLTLVFYLVTLAAGGYFISQISLPSNLFNGAQGSIWFACFMAVTLSIKPVRQLIAPLVNFRAMKEPESYLLILLTFLTPYLLLKFCIHYEVVLDRTIIDYLNNPRVEAFSLGSTLYTTLLTPVWEEILFRGVLLTILLKKLKPIWAICITAILFAFIHFSATWLFILIGGFLLTYTVYKTKSLIPAIAAHALWNLYMTQLILYF
ncbi:CPBP family intramembrane metalloprotease [Rossellomorea vietnamensis]|uniref:CPBP family intramembrane metalloprotease n=1 Tax=Rossellomorea vietnamensis TaxID=218284 RepID=A0A5D4KA22_9BACI|nr:CPBP family intramembrane glutamic endopeptidase [Rossellomorea vietnamensis]TYR73719.1 CPBP family intramembrane metalloprotease [Rossellomorea vietnamensis]